MNEAYIREIDELKAENAKLRELLKAAQILVGEFGGELGFTYAGIDPPLVETEPKRTEAAGG